MIAIIDTKKTWDSIEEIESNKKEYGDFNTVIKVLPVQNIINTWKKTLNDYDKKPGILKAPKVKKVQKEVVTASQKVNKAVEQVKKDNKKTLALQKSSLDDAQKTLNEYKFFSKMSPLKKEFKTVKELVESAQSTGKIYSLCNRVISTKLAIDKEKKAICQRIDSCFNTLDSLTLEDKNTRKIHSQVVTVIDEIFEGSKALISPKNFQKLMAESDFRIFRVIMGNFSNAVNEYDKAEALTPYHRERRIVCGIIRGVGIISDKCLDSFTKYIPIFTPYVTRLRDFLKQTGESAEQIQNDKVRKKIEMINEEKDSLIQKLETLKEKHLSLSDDSFDYLKGTRLSISDPKNDIDALIKKVKSFTAENPMSPTELKRAYINDSTPINSTARGTILGHKEDGLAFIRNLSQGVQLASLMRKQVAILENKTVYRYIPSEDLNIILEIDNNTYQSLKKASEDRDEETFIDILNSTKPNFKADAGFTSTTINRGGNAVTRFGDVELEITLPSGQKVLDLVEECEEQGEILLRKHTKFTFTKATKSEVRGMLATIKVGIAG